VIACRRAAVPVVAVALAAVVAVPFARANTITVNSLVDALAGPNCTLRNAIVSANLNAAVGGCAAGSPGMDTIVVSISGFCPIQGCGIPLMSALPTITEDLTIDGGSRHPYISGENQYRVFELGTVTVNISNLIVTRGEAGAGNGGGIHGDGTTLTLENVNIQDNHATKGGGIAVEAGTLVVNNSTFVGNTANLGGAISQTGGGVIVNGSSFTNNSAAGLGGGAIAEFLSSGLTVTGSVFAGNTSALRGGALYMQEAETQATITQTTFTNNNSQGAIDSVGGGAIYSAGKLWLAASTFTGNTAFRDGGALFASGNSVTLSNVTISGNATRGSGGGIFALDTLSTLLLDINNTTITGNTADSDNNDTGNGGGLFTAGGTVNLRNSIIAGNFDTPLNSGVGTLQPDCTSTLTSAQFNLIGRNDGCTGIANGVDGNQVGTTAAPLDPMLDPAGPQDNGGPTKTIALLPCSPAIDRGKNLAADALNQPILTDQRGMGFVRTFDFPALANAAGGDGTDIGAFELAPGATLDVDASVSATKYHAPTDGVIVLRYLFGITGSALTDGAIGGTATRDAAAVFTYLEDHRMAFDIDANMSVDPLTDGLLIARYLLGVTGPPLIQGAIGNGASRHSAACIEGYLGTLVP